MIFMGNTRNIRSVLFIFVLCWCVSSHIAIGGEISTSQYHISIVDSLGRHIDVAFSKDSNLKDIALQTVYEAKLGNLSLITYITVVGSSLSIFILCFQFFFSLSTEGGEGCNSPDCVADLLVSAMRGQIDSNGESGFDVYEKVCLLQL